MRIDELDKYSELEIIEYVEKKLLEQNKKSIVNSPNGVKCRYRGEDNCKCAIGHLIPDELYNEKTMEYNNSTDVLKFLLIELSDNKKNILRTLQIIHDSFWPNDWYKHIQRLKEKYSEPNN